MKVFPIVKPQDFRLQVLGIDFPLYSDISWLHGHNLPKLCSDITKQDWQLMDKSQSPHNAKHSVRYQTPGSNRKGIACAKRFLG